MAVRRSILVVGATGKQGGAVVDALLASSRHDEFTIVGLTRSAESVSAKRLAAKSDSIKILEGDLKDVDAIFKKPEEKFWGVFSVQTPMGNGGAAVEEQQGKALVTAAVANGVKHFVYSSVDRGGDQKSFSTPTDIPHFVSKHHIEEHLTSAASGTQMGWTILRPVTFMENFTPNFVGKVLPTAWRDLLPKDKPLQLIAVKDIGRFAAKAFLDPATYNHRAVGLAGDALTFAQLNQTFLKRTGQNVPVTFGPVAKAIMWLSKEFGYMMRWFATDGCGAKIADRRKEMPELMDLETWLEKESYWKKR